MVLKRFGLPGASREGAWQGVPPEHVLGVFFRWFLGCLVGVLGASWGVLGAFWGVLGASWGCLGASWGSLGACCGRLGVSQLRLGVFAFCYKTFCYKTIRKTRFFGFPEGWF